MIYYYKDALHSGRISLEIQGPAFRFGLGFFETLFFNGKEVRLLDAHLKRLFASLDAYQIPYHAPDFEGLIPLVLKKNSLERGFARVNIYYPVDKEGVPAEPVVAAFPYSPKPDKTYALEISPRPFHSPLGAHKSMNYMYYHLERAAALRNGFDDALITDPRGRLLETSTASLLFYDHESFVSPASENKLPGTAEAMAASMLTPKARPLGVQDLPSFKHAYVLNSLIGMKPVTRIGDLEFKPDAEPCEAVSRQVLFS
ncbi:MAG: aminotransferase class IV [Thermodesulfobacteriota bacterium]|nr:aminotransferase class IV [Thermodesulfobacteriota bacterium]